MYKLEVRDDDFIPFNEGGPMMDHLPVVLITPNWQQIFFEDNRNVEYDRLGLSPLHMMQRNGELVPRLHPPTERPLFVELEGPMRNIVSRCFVVAEFHETLWQAIAQYASGYDSWLGCKSGLSVEELTEGLELVVSHLVSPDGWFYFRLWEKLGEVFGSYRLYFVRVFDARSSKNG